MATFKLGVYGIIVSNPGAQMNVPWGIEEFEWLFNAGIKRSIAGYWKAVTAGRALIEPTVHDWIYWPSAQGLAQLTNSQPGVRKQVVTAAVQALRANGFATDIFDGIVVFVAPQLLNPAQARAQDPDLNFGDPTVTYDVARVGAGHASVKVDSHLHSVALFDLYGEHMFMAHEVGHVIFGPDHTFGIPTSTYPSGEYGDPYDIMSAMTFGDLAPTFAIAQAERGPFPGRVWLAAGPAMSPAMEWRVSKHYPGLAPWVAALPAALPETSMRLYRAGQAGTTLLAIPKNDGTSTSWLTVEYRPATDWDQGLDPATIGNSAQAGLVLHRIRDVSTAQGILPQRVSYELTIPPLTLGDLDWSNDELAVRVVAQSSAYIDLVMGAALPRVPSVRLTLDYSYGESSFSHDGQSVTVSKVGPSCKTGTYTMQFNQRTAQVVAQAASSGFVQPSFGFSVNGVVLGSPQPGGASQSAAVQVGVAAKVPVARDVWVDTPATVNVSYAQTGNTLVLDLPAGLGAYVLDVRVQVFEAGGGASPPVADSGSVSLRTAMLELPPQAIVDQTACIMSLVNHAQDIPPMHIPDDHPDWRQRIESWRPEQLASLGREIEALVQHERTTASQRASLLALAAERLDLSAAELFDVSRRMANAMTNEVHRPSEARLHDSSL